MKRNMIVLLAFVISVVMVSTPAYAVDTTGRFYIGLFGGAAIPISSGPLDGWKEKKERKFTSPDETVTVTFYPYSSEASTITGVGGIEGFYGIDKNLSIGLSLSWRQTDIDYERTDISDILDREGSVTEDGVTKGSGSVTTYTPMFLIQLRVPASELFTPYLNFGVGWNINDGEPLGSDGSDMDNFLAVKIGGGVDYFITEDISLNINTDWFYNTAKTKRSATTGDVDLNSVQILFGVRYFFPANN